MPSVPRVLTVFVEINNRVLRRDEKEEEEEERHRASRSRELPRRIRDAKVCTAVDTRDAVKAETRDYAAL